MRGQVLGVDLKTGDGQISGDDGRRYRFRPDDWSDKAGPAVGALVDFEADATGRASAIYHLPAVAGSTALAHPAKESRRRSDRNRVIAALIAFFIGTLGLHRFYLGRTGTGILMLVLSCTILGLFLTVPWALIDCVRYLAISDEEFDRRYGRD